MKNNVVLIGMPAVGKSTIGVVLAKAIGYNFLDTDIVLQNLKQKKLNNIIAEIGIDEFLKFENQAINNINVDNYVIATGGSAIYGEDAMDNLKKNSYIIYLESDFDTINSRINDLNQRGVVCKGNISLNSLYKERIPLYTKYADIIINVKNKSISQIVDEIIAIICK